MRSVDKGPAPSSPDDVPTVFDRYQDAATDLKQRLGRYCSYCERTVPVNLAVEHKRPRRHHPHLATDWSNLLLACANCNSSKGDGDGPAGSFAWPDEDDTFDWIVYSPNGAVGARRGLNAETAARVAATLELLGLSRRPANTVGADHRFADRLEIWRKAEQSKIDLSTHDSPAMRRAIVETAKSSGGYSIWQQVFASDMPMFHNLLRAFPGTRLPADS